MLVSGSTRYKSFYGDMPCWDVLRDEIEKWLEDTVVCGEWGDLPCVRAIADVKGTTRLEVATALVQALSEEIAPFAVRVIAKLRGGPNE